MTRVHAISIAMFPLPAAALALTPAVSAGQLPAPLPAEARQLLARCTDAEAPFALLADAAWVAIKSEAGKHVALRREFTEPMPDEATMVLVYASGGD